MRGLANAPSDEAAIVEAIGRVVPSCVRPTTSAAVDTTTNWQNASSDDALPAICGNGLSAPAVAGGTVNWNVVAAVEVAQHRSSR